MQLKQKTNGLFKLTIVGNNQGSIYKGMVRGKKGSSGYSGNRAGPGISDSRVHYHP